MTGGSVRRQIVRFALPIFWGNLFQQLYNIVDSLVVGNFLGSDALAAVGSSGNIIFLLVGRLLEAKGLPEYAAAAKELKTQYPAARFQLLGPPEQGLGSVDLAQVRRWQDEGSIEYLGETRDVRPYVEACHALVLPSWREGTPTSIMEGMSMGRAAVVTDVPGCREVVEDGVNGCICAAHDPRALAAAMRRLLDEPGLLVRMGAAGRDLACREFDAEVVAEKILVDMRVPRAAG